MWRPYVASRYGMRAWEEFNLLKKKLSILEGDLVSRRDVHLGKDVSDTAEAFERLSEFAGGLCQIPVCPQGDTFLRVECATNSLTKAHKSQGALTTN